MRKPKTMNKLALKWVHTPPIDWSKSLGFKLYQPDSWQELCSAIDGLIERLVMVRAYIEARTGADGCGRKDHAEGADAANKALVKIRKALGFSYPHRGTIQF